MGPFRSHDGTGAKRRSVHIRSLSANDRPFPSRPQSTSDKSVCLCRRPAEAGDTAVRRANTPALRGRTLWRGRCDVHLKGLLVQEKGNSSLTRAARHGAKCYTPRKSCGSSEHDRTALGDCLEEGTFKPCWRTVGLGPADCLPDKHPRLAPSPPPRLCCHVTSSLRPSLTTPSQLSHRPFPAANTLYGLLTQHVHGLCSHPKEIGRSRKEQQLLPCKAHPEFFPLVGKMAEEKGDGPMVLPGLWRICDKARGLSEPQGDLPKEETLLARGREGCPEGARCPGSQLPLSSI